LARELKQLAPARVLVTPRASEIYRYRCQRRGMAEGNVKIEPLVLWNTDLQPELAACLRAATTRQEKSPALMPEISQ